MNPIPLPRLGASALRPPLCFLILLGGLAAFGAELPVASSGILLVANKTDRSLGLIDPVAKRQVATVAVDGETCHEVAASADGKLAFVPIYGSGGVGGKGTDGRIVRVIDLGSRQVVHTIDFGKGVRPHEAITSPGKGLVYVTTELDDSITVIDAKTFKIVGTIPTGQTESHMLAISKDGRRGYTANVAPGTVSVLDLEQRTNLTVIPVAPKIQRISLSADDKWVFTADQYQPRLAVIDVAANRVKQWIDLPGRAYGTAATPNGRWLLVALIGSAKVGVVDLTGMQLARTLDVPREPQEILVRPDGLAAYVSCDKAAKVAVIDLQQWTVSDLIDAGAGVDGLAWATATAPRNKAD